MSRFTLFALLSFLLLGLVPLSSLFADGNLDFAAAAERASNRTGLSWTSNLLVVLRLGWVEPVLLLTLLGSLVPALAALATIGLMHRPGDFRSLIRRLHPAPGVPPLHAARDYLLLVIALLACLLVALLFRQTSGGDYTSAAPSGITALLLAIASAALLDQGAVLEELGWRGFATPELEARGTSPLRAALVIGLLWGLWHVPRDLTTGVLERLGAVTYLGLYLPAFCLGTIAISVIASFAMHRLGGSLLAAIAVHGITNDAVGISGSVSIVEALTPYHQVTKNLPLALLALALCARAGPGLGQSTETT